ncbi:MAG TPA: MFS transporter [Candidatus Baltobacteraceae bacterium]|jgi:predicted MFS family arabinose efflux permease
MLRLPRALIPIYGTTLADTLGYTLMIPLLPSLVRQFHVSDLMVGALLSVPAFCSTIAAPVWGKVSDRIGRKPIIIGSQVLTLLGYLVLATAHSFVIIFASRIASGLGAGGLGAVQSYIADVTEPKQRDIAYSLYGAVFGVAFIIGPLISGFLAKEGYSIPFFVASGLAAANIVFTWYFIPSFGKKDKPSSVQESVKAASAPGVRLVLIRQFLAILAIVCFLSNFGLFLEHVLRTNVSAIGWLLALAGAVGGAAMIFVVTPLAARIGDRRVARLGLFFSFIAYGMLWFSDNMPLFCVMLVFWAVGSAMVEPTLTSLLSVRAKASERGAVMGVSDSVNSLAMIVGPAAGAAIIGLNPRLLGVIPAVAALAAIVIPQWRQDDAKEEKERKRAKAS